MYYQNLKSFGLSDESKPPKEDDIWGRISVSWSILTKEEYEYYIDKIRHALNYNDSWWNYLTKELTWREIATIVNAYGNLQKAGEIPAFNKAKLSDKEQEQVINKIYEKSGYNKTLIRRVLNQMYYYTADGTFTNDMLLDPKKYQKNREILTKNEVYESQSGQSKGINVFEGLGFPAYTGKLIVGALVVAVAGYGLFQVNKSVELIKG